MQSAFLVSLFHALMLVGLTQATVPTTPGLTYLYSLNITGGAGSNIGPGPRGTRFVVPILGGAVAGPAFNGTVLPYGGDWALFDANGTVTIDVRQTFETDDGAFIQVFETGSSQPDGTAHVRLTFETGSPTYYWLNTVVGVGILRLVSASEITIDAWQLTSP